GAARGHRRVGEDGGTHLGGAFLYAGADAVVLASASVEVAATAALVEVLHRELAAGKDVAHALHAARRAVAEKEPHPYYHSLLRVVGLGACRPVR
ncbi:MAG: CHAT domain-containing protein, partial [Actinobacteria bacterium]|nr:CHAT domain-containing protein [Actinomycetota bacterium]